MAPETATTAGGDLSRLRISRDKEPETRPYRVMPIVIAAVVGLAILGLYAWRTFAPGLRPLEVTVGVVLGPDVAGGSGSILTASGYIVARRRAGVGPKVAGLLEYLGVEEGSRVARGQIIGRLQHKDVDAQLEASRSALEEARANLAEAEALLEQSQKEFDRASALGAQGVVSKSEFDIAEARLRSQRARVRSQRAAVTTAEARERGARVGVEDTNIRAPFSGTVLTKDAEEGETVAPAAAGRVSSRGSIVTMADLGSLEVEVDVNESYIARLSRAQPARIIADSFPETVYKGEIRQVIPTADRQKATVQVKVRIDEPGDVLRPDMGAKVTFIRPDAAAAGPAQPLPRVPSRAIALGADGVRRVWVLDGENVRPVRVETARESGGLTEVRSGLSGGEKVVLDPPPGLVEGKKVRVRA